MVETREEHWHLGESASSASANSAVEAGEVLYSVLT